MAIFVLGMNVVMTIALIGILLVGFQARDRLDRIASQLEKK